MSRALFKMDMKHMKQYKMRNNHQLLTPRNTKKTSAYKKGFKT